MASTPVQTAYTERQGKAYAGMVGGSDYNSKTGICEEADGIGFGLAVSQGAASDKGVALGGLLADFLGVTIRDVTLDPQINPDADKYRQYQNLAYVSRGQIWVVPSVAVAADDPVHYDQTTGVFTNTGGIGPIVGARYVTSAEANEPALIELQAR